MTSINDPLAPPAASAAPPPSGIPQAALDFDSAEPLELWFGDADDPDNPVGFAAFLRGDERGELLPAGQSLLGSYQMSAEFVPVGYGGRLRQADHLGRTLRPVFRRDAALGHGHGAVNLIASAAVWSAGEPEKQRWLADVLLRDGQAAAAYTDLPVGHGLVGSHVRATRQGAELRLNGRKELIANIDRADAATVLARTGDGPGHRNHALLLLDMRAVPRDRLRFLPRYRTAGLRAVHFGGVEFLDCPVPDSAVIGEVGDALETALRASPVTRATLASAAIGSLDTQLRLVTRFAVQRRIYHRSVAELPHARSVLAGAFADLMICDCLATTVCRGLHVLPGQAAVHAVAAEYLVQLLIQDAVDSLAVVLGARSFLREGPYGTFQKHLRDLPAALLAHSGATDWQATLIPQLPGLARRGWFTGEPAPAALFRLGDALPALDFRQLEVTGSAGDSLLAMLPARYAELRSTPDLGPLCDLLVTQLRTLKEGFTELAPRNGTPPAERARFDLAERYAILLAAGACLGVWWHNQHHPNLFQRDTAWLTLALRRLTALAGLPVPRHGSDVEQAVFDELVARERENRSFDLIGRMLA
jgi:alkylation response protein AidB-like acyl-CoA dehydrogenase